MKYLRSSDQVQSEQSYKNSLVSGVLLSVVGTRGSASVDANSKSRRFLDSAWKDIRYQLLIASFWKDFEKNWIVTAKFF